MVDRYVRVLEIDINFDKRGDFRVRWFSYPKIEFKIEVLKAVLGNLEEKLKEKDEK